MILLCLSVAFLLSEWGQNWLAQRVVKRFSRELETKISIDRVKITPLNLMYLEGVYVEDQNKDTLLAAGTVEVRITDWFIFKDEADLKYIGLKNAVVNLNRTDSVWNYHFLETYFSTPSSPQKKKSGIRFNLKRIEMENVAFVKKDAWHGNNLTARVGVLNMDVQDLSVSRQKVAVSQIYLKDPFFHSFSYTPLHRDSSPSNDNWNIAVNRIELENGAFRLDNGKLTPDVSYFDTRHLNFTRLTGIIRNFSLQDDVLTMNASLSGRERSGLQIRKLNTDFQLTPRDISFDNLLLQTNRSTIRNYFAMRFNSTKDLNEFLTRVRLEARFRGSVISSEDLAFFAPEVKSWKKNIRVEGVVEGTVAALHSDALEIWAGNSTHLNGAVSVTGLPDLNKASFIVAANDLRTTYSDLVSFVPDLKKVTTPNLQKLSYIQYTGSYRGRLNDFTTAGTLKTALGTITTDLHLQLPAKGQPRYNGTLATNNFQLGEFLNNRQLGVVAFNGRVNGSSFNWPTLNMNINGRVNRFQFENYTYQNIDVNGNISRQKFNGRLSMDDPNAALTLNGLIDLSGKVPHFNATANVDFANLKPLQLSKDEIVVKGNFDVNLSGNNLSNLLGTARVRDARIVHEGFPLNFDSLSLFSGYVNGLRTLNAVSNEFDVSITGNFDLGGLPDAFRLFLTHYYPAYIKRPANVKDQNFTFTIHTGHIEDYLRLIDTSLSGFNNSDIKGSLDVSANTMTIDADVPYFRIKSNEFSDVKLTGTGDFDKLKLSGEVRNAVFDSTVVLPSTVFTIEASNDVSDITLQTTSNQPVNEANLSARVTTFSDGFSVEVHPSTFVLNGKIWTIEEGGELMFRKNTVVHGELVLKEAQQEVVVRSIPSSIGNWNDLHVSIQSLNLNDLSPLLLPHNRLEGTLTGELVVEDPEHKFYLTGDVVADQLKLDNDSLGQVKARVTYDKRTGLLVARGQNADPDHSIGFDVTLNLNDASKDVIVVKPQNFQVKFLQRFLGTIFTDMEGFVTGDLTIRKHNNHQDFTGKFRLRDASLKVVFTQVTYKLEDAEIELKPDYVDLSGLRVRDSRGNLATVSGGIRHQGWTNMDYDIAVETTSSRMELLNTGYKDNEIFYGHAFGSGSFFLVGPEYDLYMRVEVRASDVDSSWVTLPPAKSRESGQANFLIEKKYGVEMTPSNLRNAGANLTYSVDLTATPMVNMSVILDELTGDYISGRGSGHLTLNSGTSIPLTISGRYDIDEGNYLFTFQSVFKKPFVLRKGANNYIEWTRDPYDAKVNIEAVYTAERVSFAPLATTLLDREQSRSLAQLRDNVNVVARMTGNLFEPDFKFNLEFPSNTGVYNNPAVAFGIQQIENNPNELYKQVTYLIVLNSFAPYESSQSAGINPFEELTFSTASGLFFNVLNRELNQLFTRMFRSNRFTFNFTGSLYNRNLIDPNARGIRLFNQVASNISIGTSLFNERAIFTVGGTFDVPLETNVQQNFQLLPDVTLEILLNKTGTVRATFFYRQNVDFLYGNPTGGSPTTKRFGAGISYNKELDAFSDLIFGRRKGTADRTATPTTPADSTQ